MQKRTLFLILLVTIGAVAFVLVSSAVLWIFRDLPYSWILTRYTETLRTYAGLNRYLVAIIHLAVLPLFVLAVKWSFLTVDTKRNTYGRLILVGMLIVYNALLLILTKDYMIGKYYAVTHTGCVFRDEPGVDPASGFPLKYIGDKDEVRHLQLVCQRVFTQVDLENTTAFNPNSGYPEVWYYQNQGGDFEFFNRPGFHPRNGKELLPISPEVVEQHKENREFHHLIDEAHLNMNSGNYEKALQILESSGTLQTRPEVVRLKAEAENAFLDAQRRAAQEEESRLREIEAINRRQEQAYRQKYLFSVESIPPDAWLIAFIHNDSRFSTLLTEAAQDVLASRRIASAAPFRDPFVTDGLYREIFAGDTSTISRLGLHPASSHIIIGILSTQTQRANESHDNLITVHADLSCRILSLEPFGLKADFNTGQDGAGFTRDSAELNAIRRVCDDLREKLEAFQ